MGNPGGQIPNFRPKMTPNIDILPPRCPFIGSIAQNWKNFNIISTFGVIFGKNECICHPRVPIYGVPPNFYAIDIEDIASRFNRNVFFAVILCYLMAKTRSILA